MDSAYLRQPKAEPMMMLAEETCVGHVVIHPYEQCTVIADFSKDWRAKNNPLVKTKGIRVCHPHPDEQYSANCLSSSRLLRSGTFAVIRPLISAHSP
jgi:hypothetical protein